MRDGHCALAVPLDVDLPVLQSTDTSLAAYELQSIAAIQQQS
jgi:hypothetical protein